MTNKLQTGDNVYAYARFSTREQNSGDSESFTGIYLLSQFFGPVYQDLDLRGIQPRISMDSRIGFQWHGATMHLISDGLKFLSLAVSGVVAKFREIELTLSVLNVLCQKPGSRLNLSIPWIAGAIRMTVVATGPDRSLHLGASGVNRKQIVRARQCIVLCRTEELQCHKLRKEHETDFLEDAFFATRHIIEP